MMIVSVQVSGITGQPQEQGWTRGKHVGQVSAVCVHGNFQFNTRRASESALVCVTPCNGDLAMM